jgi:mannose/cellobiose epimerase-like protein (N-acyl-D-glucosamine 2-epimerase family)
LVVDGCSAKSEFTLLHHCGREAAEGPWYENLATDGRFVIEAAPATSLYHIVGAIAEYLGWA